MSLKLRQLISLFLILSVSGQNLLLLPDQLRRRYQLVWSLRENRKLRCVFFLLIADLANCTALVIKFFFLLVQLIELVPHSDHLQKCIGFFFIVSMHELWKIQRELTDKFIQQLLSCSIAGRINHLQI